MEDCTLFLPAAKPSGPRTVRVVVVGGDQFAKVLYFTLIIFFGVGSIFNSLWVCVESTILKWNIAY